MCKIKKLWIGLAVILGACFAWSGLASAEFKAAGKATSGGSNYLFAKVEAGGAKFECGEPETKGAPEWTVEKEGKASEKGPSLHFKVKTWGRCLSESEKGVTRAVTASECGLEAREPNEEEEISATILSTCSFKIEVKKEAICEVKIEPKENKERKTVDVANGGGATSSSSLRLALTSVTTAVSGTACEAAGIKATHEGKLSGYVEALQVAPGRPPPTVWRLRVKPGTPNRIRFLNRTMLVQVLNLQGVASAGPGANLGAEIEEPGNLFFTIASMSVNECANFAYAANGGGAKEACTMTLEYVKDSGQTNRFTLFKILAAGGAVEDQLLTFAINV
jgi:hypothetical protein